MTSPSALPHVGFGDVQAAARLIDAHVHRTPVLTSATLDHRMESSVLFKFESFQKVGAFKARGAVNAVLSLDERAASRGVIAHSSGNHGAAVAYAAGIRGIGCTVVMPTGSSAVKIDAVRGYGAEVMLVERSLLSESTHTRAGETGATFIHPYEHLDVIAGQGTAAMELLEDHPDLDLLVVPIGGGGLISGSIVSAAAMAPDLSVIGVEPERVDDAYRSLQTGIHQPPVMPPESIADGLLAGLGGKAFDILTAANTEILRVSEKEIVDAGLFHLQRMKTVVEPSGAVPLAGLRKMGSEIQGKKVGVIVTGGNTDLTWLPSQT